MKKQYVIKNIKNNKYQARLGGDTKNLMQAELYSHKFVRKTQKLFPEDWGLMSGVEFFIEVEIKLFKKSATIREKRVIKRRLNKK